MRKTTEKSVEINVLRKLVNCLEDRLGVYITVLAPSPRLEHHVGYDEFLQGLPSGRVIALQFKRPHSSNIHKVKFCVNVPQMKQLQKLFPDDWAFYIFTPLPTHLELIENYHGLLDCSMAVDVHNIWQSLPNKKRTSVTIGFDDWSPYITINRQHHRLNAFRVTDFCHEFQSDKIGISTDNLRNKLRYLKPMKDRPICFLHISDVKN